MKPHPDRPETWPGFLPLIIAHDVGCTRDRSTAVIGGGSPFQRSIIGIHDCAELPQGLIGSARASALAAIDRQWQSNALIVADLRNEASYGEFLLQTFGHRVIGLQITRHGDGMKPERRPTGAGHMLVYNVGRSYLIEHLHSLMANRMVRFTESEMNKRAFGQLVDLQTEIREGSGIVYTPLPGHHDDLGISCCMLAWATRHPHLTYWMTNAQFARQPQMPRITAKIAWSATT